MILFRRHIFTRFDNIMKNKTLSNWRILFLKKRVFSDPKLKKLTPTTSSNLQKEGSRNVTTLRETKTKALNLVFLLVSIEVHFELETRKKCHC